MLLCSPRKQRPGYTKIGVLKNMLNYHKHQAAMIAEQLKVTEAQASVRAALEESNAVLLQQIQQHRT